MNSRLHDFLTQEHSAILVYADLLDQEAKALSDGEFASLPGLAQRKSTLADQISLLGQQRDLEQLALGYPAGRDGADAACAAGRAATEQVWHDLLQCAAQAKDRNHRNGVMIHTHLDFTRNTISFLQAGGKPLYGPDGSHKTGTGGGHSLACG